MSYVNNDNYNSIARAISVYADAARADAALMLSTGIVGSDARVSDSGEGYTGVIRWLTYMDAVSDSHVIGKPSAEASLSADLVADDYMTLNNYAEQYAKNVGVAAARENSIQSLISRQDGLSFLGRQFGAVRARREDAQLRSVLKGIAAQVWGSTSLSADTDAAVVNLFGYHTAYTHTGTTFAPLFSNSPSSNDSQRARSPFFDQLLNAMTAIAGEHEEPFYYMAVTPQTYNLLRKENILDGQFVQDGNISFATILGGKIRLLVTGNANSLLPANAGTAGATQVSVLMKPGYVHYSNVSVNNPTAIDTNVVTNKGFGDVSIVNRWANIIHPRGYSIAATDFLTNAQLEVATPWTTVATNVNQTGIFPIFHGTNVSA